MHEALLMELPVVAPATTALATLLPGDDVGFPVRATPQPVSEAAAAETPTFAGLTWHEPEARHLGERMREVFENPDAARARGRAGRRHILRLCDRDRVGSTLRALLAGPLATLEKQP